MQEDQQISLRPATEDDLPKVLDIEKGVQPAPWTEDHFRAEMAKPYSRVWVMTDDETDSVIFGFVVFWILGEECQLLSIAVDKAFRRRGLGKIMVLKVISDALRVGAKKVILDVRKSNEAAINLYQSIGFSVTKVLKSYYSNGEDAYQMTLGLEGEKVEF